MEEGDDARIRTGTLWTVTAHAIASILGSGVLALPWSIAQLGWVLGPLSLVGFAWVTYYTATFLCDCYRSPGPINGKRNHTYIDAVRAFLGANDVFMCAVLQYANLWGTMIGYTITAAMSMAELKRTHCHHNKGHDAKCNVSGTLFLIIVGACEIMLSQIPNLEQVSLLSVVAVITSFVYSFISLCLCITKFALHPKFQGSLMNLDVGMGNTLLSRIWLYFQALGNIAFAYTYSNILIEIQDTLRSPPPENKTMKRANLYAITTTTLFYVSLGCMGYIGFGNEAPGNILTGFYEPYWLIDIANVAVIIHLITAYQVFAQPIFALNEEWLSRKWPTLQSVNHVYTLKLPGSKRLNLQFTLSTLLLRSAFVLVTTLIAMTFPFFNAIVGLLGAVSFWPLTVYFPVSMYIVQSKIERRSLKWMALQILSMICLVVTIVSVVGSIVDIIERLQHAKFFDIEL